MHLSFLDFLYPRPHHWIVLMEMSQSVGSLHLPIVYSPFSLGAVDSARWAPLETAPSLATFLNMLELGGRSGQVRLRKKKL